MFVSVDARGMATLQDALDFKRFKIVLPRSSDHSVLAGQLASLVKFESKDTAWISVAEMRQLGPQENNAEWQDGVTAMLTKATGFGWVSADGAMVRAHVEIDG